MRFIHHRKYVFKYLGFAAGCTLLTTSAVSSALPTCGDYWTDDPGYIANGKRGDIVLTRRADLAAAAVTGPHGQYFTHSGMLLSPTVVRHNTADPTVPTAEWKKRAAEAVGLVLPGLCYSFGATPEIRHGQPGLADTQVTDLATTDPWNTGDLYLLKPKDEGSYRAAAMGSADALQTVSGQGYDVFSYMNYQAALPAGSMCSGSMKYATDLAGYGGFNLVTYSSQQVHSSATSLFNYVYNNAVNQINNTFWTDVPLIGRVPTVSPACRQLIAAGVANKVVSCFADGSCDRGGVKDKALSEQYWAQKSLPPAVSISPDNLIYNQPGSLYSAVVKADYRPRTWRYVSTGVTCPTCISGTVGTCPNSSSTRYCYNGAWTPCP